MRILTEFNRGRVGLMGITVLVLVVAVAQTFTSVPMLFASPSYYGQFANTGQLKKNDKVRISGVNVGKVQALEIDGNHVLIKFSVGGKRIGTESRLAIKTDNILGRKVLEIESRGTQTLRPGAVLPLRQSTIPYEIYDANFDITKAATGWDLDTIKRSLNVLSQTINQTSPRLTATLNSLTKFSDSIGKRDEQIKHLLAQAHQVASVLGDRSEQINRLLVNANTLLAAFNERGQAIDALLHNISAFSADVNTGARQRVPWPRQRVGWWGVGTRRSGWDGRSRVIGCAFEHRRRGRWCAVGEPGAVGVGPAELGQPGAAPEVLRVDAALLEGGVDERLQNPIRQQVGYDDLEVRSRRHGFPERCGELTHRSETLGEVGFACHEQVTDGMQLLQHGVQARIVVDEPLYVGREGGNVVQQRIDGLSAFVEGGQQ
ncbi:MCE family protein, partial [Mycobacterium sp. E3251]|uniref:MCE family protein n=1 Tax=Mycobacterium sp. E3251 TaxID=1834144 RepID=UPI0012E89F93